MSTETTTHSHIADLPGWLRSQGRTHPEMDPAEAEWCSMLNAAANEIERLRAIIDRSKPLVQLVTVGMAIEAGDEAIQAAGLNPWCINEGLATGDEQISTWWMQ